MIKTIMEAARTGDKGAFGDGKIFVSPVEEVYTVSSGVEGESTCRAIGEAQAMKEVMAVIRMNKMNQTKQALADAGIAAFTAREAWAAARAWSITCRAARAPQQGYEEAIAQLWAPGPSCSQAHADRRRARQAGARPWSTRSSRPTRPATPATARSSCCPSRDAVRVRTGETGDCAIG